MLGYDNRSGLRRFEGGVLPGANGDFEQKGTKVTKGKPEAEGVTRSV